MSVLTITGQAAGTGGAGYTVTDTPATFHGGLFTASRITAPGSVLDIVQGWAAFRFKTETVGGGANQRTLLGWALADGDFTSYIAGGWDKGTVGGTFMAMNGSNYPAGDQTIVAGNLTSGSTHTMVFAWTIDTFKFSLDNGAFVSTPRFTRGTCNSVVDLGSFNSAIQPSTATLLWVAMGRTSFGEGSQRVLNGLPDNMATRMIAGDFPIAASLLWPAVDATYYSSPVPVLQTGGSFAKYDIS